MQIVQISLEKCKSVQSNQFIHAFWVINGTVRLKAVENGRVHVITDLSDLKELFPEKQLLSEEDYILHFAYIFMFYFIFKSI